MSDRGGGVPLRKIERLFSYMYSTAPTPQPGTGGTPLVRWFPSCAPHFLKDACLFTASRQTVTLPVSRFLASRGLRSCVAVCGVSHLSQSGPPPAPPIPPACSRPPPELQVSVCHLSSILPLPLAPHEGHSSAPLCHAQQGRWGWVWELETQEPRDLSRPAVQTRQLPGLSSSAGPLTAPRS